MSSDRPSVDTFNEYDRLPGFGGSHLNPGSTLLASAKRLTRKTMTRIGSNKKSWQEDAWEMYDLVGEQRFLSNTLAGRMSQAHLFVGKASDDPMEPPEALDDSDDKTDILDSIGSSESARSQMLMRMGINLFVAGDSWLAGIPSYLMPEGLSNHPVDEDVELEIPKDLSQVSIDDLEWRVLSVSEVSTRGLDEVVLQLGESEDEKVKASPDDLFLIRIWRPHPRRWWEADSPTRSSLSILRELVGLTMHISAQVDSRLAGAGLLVVPQSAQRSLNIAAGLDEDSDTDPFTEALMEAMLTPIGDRANASAMVPLVVTVPDEVTETFNYMTFAKPLDTEAKNLRDEAIRRLALGQDAPPELLLGVGGMNHWGAWLVREDVVTTHIEPPLALICDALTSQFLWPVLIEQGMDPDEAHEYVIWYDVSHMIMRPNRSADALALHNAGVISDASLREASGFSDVDKPTEEDVAARIKAAMPAEPAPAPAEGQEPKTDDKPAAPPAAQSEPDGKDNAAT